MGPTVNIQHAPAAASVAEKLATAGQNLSIATAVTAAQSSVHLKKKKQSSYFTCQVWACRNCRGQCEHIAKNVHGPPNCQWREEQERFC